MAFSGSSTGGEHRIQEVVHYQVSPCHTGPTATGAAVWWQVSSLSSNSVLCVVGLCSAYLVFESGAGSLPSLNPGSCSLPRDPHSHFSLLGLLVPLILANGALLHESRAGRNRKLPVAPPQSMSVGGRDQGVGHVRYEWGRKAGSLGDYSGGPSVALAGPLQGAVATPRDQAQRRAAGG